MWYYLDYNPETKIFKVTDQTKDLYGKALEVKERFFDIHYDQHLEDDDIILDYIEIKASSIFSDILWDYLYQGEIKIISEKSWQVIREFNLLNLKNYLTIVKRKDISKKYYSLRGFGEIYQFIDFNKSSFSWYKSKIKHSERINFDNEKKYREFSKSVGPIDSINPIEIFFTSEFINKEYDLIPLGYLKPCSFLISKRLKEKLDTEKLIGFEFKECEYIKN